MSNSQHTIPDETESVPHQDSPPQKPKPHHKKKRHVTVELGDFGDASEPVVRYLMGRVPLRPFILSTYLLETIGLAGACLYTLKYQEWSFPVVVLTWTLAFTWIWLYSISYRYRRKINYIYCLLIFILHSISTSYFCFERSLPQSVFDGKQLVSQPFSFYLAVSAICSAVAGGVIFLHAIYFGRGYRERHDSNKR